MQIRLEIEIEMQILVIIFRMALIPKSIDANPDIRSD